ncbi:MAG TPA: C40 family peptidase [Mycobacteriales bacterium]|nr:C40 family peptidase [Mycobacteriales bacterium]
MATLRTVLGRARFVLPVFAAVALLPLGPASSAASPTLSVTDVQQHIAALDEQVQRQVEAYDGARVTLGADERSASIVAARYTREHAAVLALQRQMGLVIAAAYTSGDLTDLGMLLSSNPTAFAERTASLDQLSYGQANELNGLTVARHQLASAALDVRRAIAIQRATLAQISADKAVIDEELAQAQAYLASLSAADQAAYYANQAAEAAAQAAQRNDAPFVGDARAAIAVRFAYAQLGKPYVYGAAGPDSYDCSGLTMAAWGAAGVYLPHNAAMQQASVPAVPLGDLQPGDLVFFGSPAYHEAMYVGNGNLIEAPHTGDVVRIVSLNWEGGISGAGRP